MNFNRIRNFKDIVSSHNQYATKIGIRDSLLQIVYSYTLNKTYKKTTTLAFQRYLGFFSCSSK